MSVTKVTVKYSFKKLINSPNCKMFIINKIGSNIFNVLGMNFDYR